MGRRQKWLFPKCCDGTNTSRIRQRENTGHAVERGGPHNSAQVQTKISVR